MPDLHLFSSLLQNPPSICQIGENISLKLTFFYWKNHYKYRLSISEIHQQTKKKLSSFFNQKASILYLIATYRTDMVITQPGGTC